MVCACSVLRVSFARTAVRSSIGVTFTLDLAYDWRMKSNPKLTPEFQKFDSAMRQVLQISKTELLRRIEEEKQAHAGRPKRGPKPKSAVSDHASSEKD